MKDKIIDLIENLSTPLSTQNINLVCDGGAFNGLYMIGSLYYLKELEKKKYIKINKFSGSSAGALLACAYIIDKLDEANDLTCKIRSAFKSDFCLKSFKTLLGEFFGNLDENIYTQCNERLFINYYNINTGKEEVQSNYTNNDDIKDALLSSSFIPYVMNGKLCYNGHIDGFNPHIFNERTIDDDKILFIKLTTYGKLKKMLHVKGEHNNAERILEGILDTHHFFKGDKSTLCSWINNWGVTDYLVFRSRQVICLYIVFCCYIIHKLKPYTPLIITDNKLVNILKEFIYKIYQDLFIIFYNS